MTEELERTTEIGKGVGEGTTESRASDVLSWERELGRELRGKGKLEKTHVIKRVTFS